MRTQEKDDKVQFAVTLSPAIPKAEKNKDTSIGVTERIRIRRDISYPRCGWKVGTGKNMAWHPDTLF